MCIDSIIILGLKDATKMSVSVCAMMVVIFLGLFSQSLFVLLNSFP